MAQRTAVRLKALLLILMALFFAEKFWSGKLYYYIGPRFSWLAIVAVALLIILAGAYNLVEKRHQEDIEGHDHNHADHDHAKVSWGSLIIIAIPLVLGMVVPARPLGASAIDSRGVSTDIAIASGSEGAELTIVPSERNILDWVRVMNTISNPADIAGQEADVVGFVYRDPRFDENQFMVGRFTLTCCVADALAIGVIVQTDSTFSLNDDTWVRVTGIFAEGSLNDQDMPVLMATSIERVQEPEQPYLYP